MLMAIEAVEELSAHEHLRTLRVGLPAFCLLRVFRQLGARVGRQVAPAGAQVAAGRRNGGQDQQLGQEFAHRRM